MLVASILPLAGPSAGAVQGTGSAPDALSAVKRDVLRGDQYGITCDGATSENNGSAVIFFVFTDRTWNISQGGQGWGSFGTTQARLRITADGTTLPELPYATFDPEDLSVPEWSGTVRSQGRLRVVWASWNTAFDCDVFVNGYEMAETPLTGTQSVQARLPDFGGGASADADLIGAGTQLTFTRDVDGFVYSWFWASGSISNKGPSSGQSAQNRNTFWPGVSTGTWTYKMNYGYEVGSPRVFLLETPV